MRFAKSFELALNILIHSKLRSWLTIIGIVIGVAAVVAIVSIGEGMQQSVEASLSGLGADLITISPGGGRATFAMRGFGDEGGGSTSQTQAQNLTKKDVQAIMSVENIAAIDGTVSARAEVYYLSEKTSLSVEGVDPVAWLQITTAELDSGRFLGASDYGVIVVGNSVATKVFKEQLVLNRILTIEGKNFKIVGILKPSSGFGGDDNRIIMPINAARDTLGDVGVGREEFDSITIKVTDPTLVTQAVTDIDNKLMITRHLTASRKDYSVTSSQATQARIDSTIQTLTLFLGAIAAVSLLVGAVGIANTMFTSVLEKTKEIGIMKAIGARDSDIMKIFILNAAMVGLVGGIIGITLGAGISSLIPSFGIRLMGGGGTGGGMHTSVSFTLLATALFISVSVGVIAGAIPAYRASKLNPVDALRYE